MRSKVERRMRKESGKTLREIRRAKKIKKKLMTEEERLLYNLKRVCHLVVIVHVADFERNKQNEYKKSFLVKIAICLTNNRTYRLNEVEKGIVLSNSCYGTISPL